MSNLPELDSMKIIQKFSEKTTDLTYQVIQLTVLSETLRDQRDSVLRERHEAQAEVEKLKQKLQKYEVAETTVVESTVVDD